MPAAITSTQVADGRVIKRKKLNASKVLSDGKQRPTKSRLFAPFRTVGLISPTDVPFTSVPLGKTTFQITTSVGRSLQTYDLRRGLNLVFITRPQTPEDIVATTAWKDKVLAAWGGKDKHASRGVWLFKRGKKVAELETPKGWDENIKQLLVFGAWIVGCGSTRIDVWKSETLEHYTTLIAPRAGSTGSLLTGGVCNMPTYLNKILAGRQDGSVEIWNVNTGRLLYTILPAAAEYGHVTALQPTPVLSLVAIAYSSGPVVIHDIRADKEILTVNTGSSRKAAVTSISFRTDGQGAGEDGRKDGVMATASKHTGDVIFWDLNGGGRKMGVLRGAHAPPSTVDGGVAGGISKIEFLAGQAVVVTSGLDNSLKTWIFDQTPFSPVPRILHSRSGHSAPVSTLQFLPSDADGADAGGKWLVSASKDRTLWGWSLRRDGQSTELSQGNIRKKAKKMGILSEGLAALDSSLSIEDLRAPKITCMACSLNRDGGMGAVPGVSAIWNNPSKSKGTAGGSEATGLTGWESMVTAHEDSKTARTWFWGKKKAGRWAFDTGDGTPVTSVAMSPCGTFALVGSRAGGLDMFNLQSGIHRQRFPPKLTPQQAKRLKLHQLEEEESMEVETKPKKFARGQGKHIKAVTGITVDNLNRTVISCGEDGKVKFWDFTNGQLLHEIDWYPMVTVTSLRYHNSSDLIAFACSDSSIRVVDIETKKLVRELFGCQGQITDFTFSNDGRWIIAASADSIIRVWDLPTGHMIDALKLRSKCTSLGMSATGEYLAVAQEDNVGVDIWTNKTLFTHVPTRHISDDEIAEVDAPTASGEGGENIVSAAYAEDEQEQEEEDAGIPSVDQLSESITTLSLVPKSRWQNLLHLDLIRERNKPKEAPKAPEKAPFFLPGLNGAANAAVNGTIAGVDQQDSAAKAGPVSRISKSGAHQSEFSRHLASASETGEYDALVSYLSTLPPSAADLAIRSLETPPSHEFLTFIQALTARLRQKRDYELVQAWMAVFLRLHGEDITSDEEVVEALKEWREEAGKERQRLGSLGGYCVGVVGFLRSAR